MAGWQWQPCVIPAPLVSFPPPLCHSREGGNPGAPTIRWIPAKNCGNDRGGGGHTRRQWAYWATVGMPGDGEHEREEGGSGQSSLVSAPPVVISAPLVSFPPPLCHSREGGNPGVATIRWIPAKNCGNDRGGRRACQAAVGMPGGDGHAGGRAGGGGGRKRATQARARAPLCHSRESGNPGVATIRWIPAKNCGNDREGRRACQAAVGMPGGGHTGRRWAYRAVVGIPGGGGHTGRR